MGIIRSIKDLNRCVVDRINCKFENEDYNSFSLEELEWLYESKYRIVVNNGSIEYLVYEKLNK